MKYFYAFPDADTGNVLIKAVDLKEAREKAHLVQTHDPEAAKLEPRVCEITKAEYDESLKYCQDADAPCEGVEGAQYINL